MANFFKNQSFVPFQAGVITIYNRKKVVLEGVERIIFCDSEKMIIKNRTFTKILGKKLRLMELGNQNIAVCGEIDALEFEKGMK